MSLNAQHRSVMIFSDSQEKAELKLIELMNEIDEPIIVRKRDYIKTESKTIQAKKWSLGCRGYRYQEVYVDRVLDEQETMIWITMKMVTPKDPVKDGYVEGWDWREHLQWF